MLLAKFKGEIEKQTMTSIYRGSNGVHDDFSEIELRPDLRDTVAGPVRTEMYGKGLRDLCNRTQSNLNRLSREIKKERPQSAHTIVPPSRRRGTWENIDVMFTDFDCSIKLSGAVDEGQGDYVDPPVPYNGFCYLCSTMEEHKKHMLHHKPPKRPSSAKPRVEYIAPKPKVKRKSEDEEEILVRERLYKIEVFTSDLQNAGTSAKVFITIKGSLDVLPRTQLVKKRGCANFCFVQGSKEVFHIMGPLLGNLQALTVEHDGRKKFHGWHLDRIEITDVKALKTWVFHCGEWLSMFEKPHYSNIIDLKAEEKHKPLTEQKEEDQTSSNYSTSSNLNKHTGQPTNSDAAKANKEVTSHQGDTSTKYKDSQEHVTQQEIVSSESSDDNLPIQIVIDRLQERRDFKKKYKLQPPTYTNAFTDDDNSDVDNDYIPPDECSSPSDECYTPVVPKRKRKWVRKRIRPLRREEGRARMKLNIKKTLSPSIEIHDDRAHTAHAIKKSKTESNLNKMLQRFAKTRIQNLLSSHGLQRQLIPSDGNCYFSSIIHQLDSDISVMELRTQLCQHLMDNEKHYIGYISHTVEGELQISDKYRKMVAELGQEGIWNVEMSDVLPLATANMLQRNVTIYSSRLNNPVIHIVPNLETTAQNETTDIKLAYLIIPGHEHYDSCVPESMTSEIPLQEDISNQTARAENTQVSQTPNKKEKSPSKCITPRKLADYISPIKVKQSRKKERNEQNWKKNVRKAKRNTGQSYVSDKTNQTVPAKKLLFSTCNHCKNKCSESIDEETRQNIFMSYYQDTMSFERKRDFICQNIEVTRTSNRYGQTRKHQTRKFYLPVEGQRIRVCRSFFLNTLCIGKKVVECSLQKKEHGKYKGSDLRGRHTPANKTGDDKMKFVKEHIEAFPTVESHYTRQKSRRKFLNQDLSVRKMYELYRQKCQENDQEPVSEKVYRNTFCKDYNFSFHKPKKDTCQTCNTFNELKKSGTISDESEKNYREHIFRKEEARIEKDADKKNAKSNNALYVATFDLQAVLQTPCSNVSQTYYKRKLNSYNLTVYSLSDAKGTCYVWNEVHGQRGSSEIGTCIMTHLNSLPSSIKHVILYSDCCSGQNRNKYLASGLLKVVSTHPHIEVIEQKFLESGHTQMECDSMHSAIEHAKKQTSLYVPEQWDTIFQMARRNNPYSVIPLRYDNFFDLKAYAQSFKNFKTGTDGSRVNWLKVKVLKVQKCYPDEIFVKYKYSDPDFICIEVQKCLRGRPSEILPMKYKEKLPISVAKKKDLIDLCQGLIIPEIYWPYYENLKTDKLIKDKLPAPDVLENSESDED